MTPEETVVVAYSPTGASRAAALAVARALGGTLRLVDVTRRPCELELGPDDLAVLGTPVHDGRLPRLVGERLEHVRGTFTPAVLVASYGGRSWGTGLEELAQEAREHGFVPVAAIAWPTVHGQLAAVPGAGRFRLEPGGEERLTRFGREVRQQLEGAGNVFDVEMPTLEPGPALAEHPERAVKASCDASLCVGCGACPAACPLQCIPADEPYLTNRRRCNGCGACVRVCPVGARTLGPAGALAKVAASVDENAAARAWLPK